MYQRNSLDVDARESGILMKDLAIDASMGRSSSEWKTAVSGSATVNINLQESWQSDVNRYSRQPEFIETDFTAPLTEITRPLSLNSNEVPRSDEYANANKRPYSANQVSERSTLSRSLTFLNMPPNPYSSTYQGNEHTKFFYNAYFSRAHGYGVKCTDATQILITTSAENGSNNTQAIFSQRSSLPQCTSTAKNHIHNFTNKLPSFSSNRKIEPTFMTSSSKPNFDTVPYKNHFAYLSDNSRSANLSEFSTFPLPSRISHYSFSSNNAFNSAPLNLSKSNGHFQTPCRVEPEEGKRQSDEMDCESPTPLNLILKKEKSNELGDSSAQSTFTKNDKLTGRLAPVKLCTSDPFHLVEVKNGDRFFPSNNLAKSSPAENDFPPCRDASSTDIKESCKLLSDEDDSQTGYPLPQSSKNVSSPLDVSIKDEVKSCKSLPEAEDGPPESDDSKFIWDDYLEHCGAVAAPSASFGHVECSLQNSLKKGMLVEVANRDPEGTFWVASIVTSCGRLLMLRPACCRSGVSLDFWCDMSNRELHPIGWSDEHRKRICPPGDVADKVVPNWESTLRESLAQASTPTQGMLDQKSGSLPFDQINVDTIYEVQHEASPGRLWYARVVDNVGGRLSLRYEGGRGEFWLFYTSHRLHPPGFSSENGKSIVAPDEVVGEKSVEELEELAARCKEEAANNGPPAEVFKDQEVLEEHEARVGWRMELLDTDAGTFRVAHVSEIVDGFYFVVQSDDLSESGAESAVEFCCHKKSSIIFPVGWHSDHGIKLQPVPGYNCNDGLEFDWVQYLERMSLEAAPSEFFFQASAVQSDFERGMKLEATDSRRPDEICAATIEDVKGPLFWIRLDHDPFFVMIVPRDSHEIFPIGWCESNNYQLKTPPYKSLGTAAAAAATSTEESANCGSQPSVMPAKKSSGWCPKVYFNTKCYSGPFMSKWKIRNLPKSVGPGPVVSVMAAVLAKLITSGYKTSRVLRELQLEGLPNPGMHQQILKTRYDAKNYSATVEICTSASQVEQFCRDVCRRLICCPNLISTHLYPSVCPENCLKIAKSKHYFHFGERRRQVGRPRGGHSNIEHLTSEEQNSGHRRKKYKKKHLLTTRKKHGSSSAPTRSGSSETEGSSSDATASGPALTGPRGDAGDLVEKSEEEREAPMTTSQEVAIVDSRPSEPVTKLRIVCSREKEDGNRSYVIRNDSREVDREVPGGVRVPRKRRQEARDDDDACDFVKPSREVHRKYDVQTRGISLTKNYSFEKKTHKKIFIIPPAPPSRDLPPAPLQQPGRHSNSHSGRLPTNPREPVTSLKLTSNPAEWSVQQVTDFIKRTDCSKLSKTFREQEIDGKSLLLLTLPTVQEFIEPKLGPAVKLCDLIERLRRAFFSQYANAITI